VRWDFGVLCDKVPSERYRVAKRGFAGGSPVIQTRAYRRVDVVHITPRHGSAQKRAASSWPSWVCAGCWPLILSKD
jgi:hypothetical protein